MRVGRLAIAALAAVGLVTAARLAGAACNVIPTARDQLVSGPNPNDAAIALTAAVLAEEQRHGGLVPYKAALGRIDRAFLSRDRKKPVRVGVDGRCVAGGRRAAFEIGDTKDLVATVVFTAPDRSLPRAVIASGGKLPCEALFPKGERLTVTQCSGGGIKRHGKYPSVLELSLPKGEAVPEGRQARIAVFRAPAADAARAMLDRLSTTSCERLCGEDAEAALAVCVDTLYTPAGLERDEITYVPDLVKCTLQTVPDPIPWNDFRHLCEKDPEFEDLPECDGASEPLSFWKDGCHGIYVPFDWTAIRDGNDRVVRGQSAISRWGDVKGKRGWVPGREYVGVLVEADLGPDPDFRTNPREAEIDVWTTSKEEFGFAGIVDKEKSIIHVVPQLVTHYVCDDDSASNGSLEACMQVATQLSDEKTRCACGDRYEVGCTCSTLQTGQLFECRVNGNPCTRHNHCNLKRNDTCSAQPRCREEGAVWGKSAGPAGSLCWTRADCTNPARPQCGYLLFDPREKIEPDGLARIDKTIEPAASRKQRGVCKKTSGSNRKACSNAMGGDPTCPPDDVCMGYVLEAREKREKE